MVLKNSLLIKDRANYRQAKIYYFLHNDYFLLDRFANSKKLRFQYKKWYKNQTGYIQKENVPVMFDHWVVPELCFAPQSL